MESYKQKKVLKRERERESVRNVLLGVVSMGRLYFRACCFSFFPSFVISL